MQKRIEQLVGDGFAIADATRIAQAELARARQLLSEGFKREAVVGRAQRDVKFAALVAAKRLSGALTPEQCEAVATAQVEHDERLGLAKVDTAVAAAFLKDLEAKEEAKQG